VDDVDAMELCELRQQCRAVGVSTEGRRENLSETLKAAIIGPNGTGRYRQMNRAKTSQGLRSHRRANAVANEPHNEGPHKALVAKQKRIKQLAADNWQWGPPLTSWQQLPSAGAAVPNPRAKTSVPGSRTRRSSVRTPMSQRSGSQRSLGSDKGAIRAVLESNSRLMGQITDIRGKLQVVNEVMNDAQGNDNAPNNRQQTDNGASNRQAALNQTRPAAPAISNFDQIHKARLGSGARSATPSSGMQPSQMSLSFVTAKTRKSPSLSHTKPQTTVALTTSARGLLGPTIPTTRPKGIPGAQKIGQQRGAGENGQMRGDPTTSVTFCPAPPSLSHRISSIHRTHNAGALGDIWKGKEGGNVSAFESFRVKTRPELVQEAMA